MIIDKNTITFDAADTAQLTSEIQSALADYNEGGPAEEALSGVINSFIALAQSVAVARNLDKVKTALVSASATDRAAAQGKIDEAKVILGVQFSPKL